MTDTGRAKLPGLPAVSTGDTKLDRWIQLVTERLEVREGSRGNPYERAVTLRELQELGINPGVLVGMRGNPTGGTTVTVQNPNGGYTDLSLEAFIDLLRQTHLWKTLTSRIEELTYDTLPEKIRDLLKADLLEEAAKRGADIRLVEEKIQSANLSLATRVSEVTAGLGKSVAGVRQLTFATAESNRVTAGEVTQIKARLDTGFSGGSIEQALTVVATDSSAASTAVTQLRSDFNANKVAVEQAMTAFATKDEFYGQYTVRINANGAATGFGLSLQGQGTNWPVSTFLIQADRFALVAPDRPGTQAHIPFGVDSINNIIYLNSQVRIGTGASAPTLGDLTTGARSLTLEASSQTFVFAEANSDTTSSPDVTLTAVMTGGLAGTVTWTITPFNGSSAQPVIPVPSGTTSTLVLTKAMFVGAPRLPRSTHVVVTASVTSGGTTFSDTFTVFRLNGGADALVAFLTNEAHTVACDTAGNLLSGEAAKATTEMKVFKGGVDDTTNWTFSKVDAGLTTTQSTTGSRNAFTLATMTQDTGVCTITASRAGSPSLAKSFTVTKSKQGVAGADGADGDPGLDGDDGVAYWLVTSAPAIQRTETDVFNPAKIEYKGMRSQGVQEPTLYMGRLVIDTSEDGELFGKVKLNGVEVQKTYTHRLANNTTVVRNQLYISEADEERVFLYPDKSVTEITVTDEQVPVPGTTQMVVVKAIRYNPVLDKTKALRVRLYVPAALEQVSGVWRVKTVAKPIDELITTVVNDGAGGVSLVLSNEAHTLPATNAGVVSTYAGSGTDIWVYEGGVPLAFSGGRSNTETTPLDPLLWALAKNSSGKNNLEPGTWKFNFVPVGSGITLSSTFSASTDGATFVAGTVSSLGNLSNGTIKVVRYGDHSVMLDTTDVAGIDYNIVGRTRSGTPFILSKRQTFAKAKQGTQGTQGAPGASGSIGISRVSAPSSTATAAAVTTSELDAAITSKVNRPPVDGDSVNLYNQSAKWSDNWVRNNSAWSRVTLYVNGSAVIDGTLWAGTVATAKVIISPRNNTYQFNNPEFVNGIKDITVTSAVSGISNLLYGVAFNVPANVYVTYAATGNTATSLTLTFKALEWTGTTFRPYSGFVSSISVFLY